MENTDIVDRQELDPDIARRFIADDELGREDLVNDIADVILNHKKSDPLIIGLYGSWGCGKTSILNFIEEEIEKRKKVKVNGKAEKSYPYIINFDPWIFANQEELIKRFIESLINILRNDKDKFKNILSKLERWLENLKFAETLISKKNIMTFLIILGSFGILENIKSVSASGKPTLLGTIIILLAFILSLSQDSIALIIKKLTRKIRSASSLIQLRDSLKNELEDKDFKDKILIFIDEIDRLNKEETKLIFQLVKSTFNLPNLIFILAFDNNKIAELISENDGDASSGQEYIEKIIQIPISIPMPDYLLFQKFIEGHINSFLKPIPDDKFDLNLWRETYYSGLSSILTKAYNPRKVVRLCNLIKCHLFRLMDKINPVDFIAITAIQVNYPELYNFIKINKPFFTQFEPADISEHWDYEKDEERLKKLFNDFTNKYDKNVLLLIDKLFPGLNSKLGPESQEALYKGKRIASGKCFDTYFNLKLPEGNIEHSDYEYFINSLSESKDFQAYLEDKIKDNTLPKFLDDLGSYLDEFPYQNIKKLITALINVAEIFPYYYEKYLFSPLSTAHQLIKRLLAKASKRDAVNILTNAIGSADGISLAVMTVDIWLMNKEKGELHEIQVDTEYLENLKNACVRKIDSIYESGDLFNVNYLGTVLVKWKEWGKEDFKLKSFLDSTVKNETRLPVLLEHFVVSHSLTDSEGTRDVYKFDFEILAKIGADTSAISNKIQTIINDRNRHLEERQLRAVKLYYKDHGYYKETNHNREKFYTNDEIIQLYPKF